MDSRKIDSHKLHYHLDALHQWKSGDRKGIYPIYVEISPVGNCNHRCTFCAVDYLGYKARHLDTRALESSLTEMAIGGTKSVMLAGEGEPLLHPDIGEICYYANGALLDVAITTNAVAMGKGFINYGLEYCTWIKASVNAGTPESYAKIHRTKEKDWHRVWDNLRAAVVERNRNALSLTIGVQCVALPENQDTLIQLLTKCIVTEVDYLVIKPYSHHTKSNTTAYKNIKYNLDNYSYLKSLAQSSNFELIVRDQAMKGWMEEDRGYEKCYSTPYFWAYVMSNGDVYACSAYLGDERFRLGNIHNESFKGIWEGEKRKRCCDFVERELDILECRKNCRMNEVNKFLWEVKHGGEHRNFI